MPQDAFTLHHLAKELSSVLVGGKVSKINQPEKDELSFIIYTKEGSVKLEISAQAQTNRISFSQDEKPNPQQAPNFCMLLRKYLQNAEITKLEQIAFERVILLTFHAVSDFSETDVDLYCELMGKYSNLILVQDGIILGALKTTSLEENTKRILFAGAKYVPPLPQDKADPTDLAALQTAWKNTGSDTAKSICNVVQGIAYSTALDMVALYGEGITARQIHEYVVGNSSPCVTYQGGIPEDFRVRSQITQKVSYPTLWQAQEAYYSYIYQKNTFEGKKRKLEGALHSAVKKAEKRLAQMEQKLLECEQAEELKLKGELITANLWQIERGMESFTAVNYYDENQATIKIALDKQLTPSQNAQKYYKKYAKQKRTISSLTEQKSEVLAKLDYLQSIVGAVSTADHLNDFVEIEEELIGQGLVKAPTNEKRKKKAIETPYRQYEFQSFKILAGRNNLQNERLVKTLSPEDIWLHTQKYHSSHVAILTEGRKVPDDVLGFAASVCAYYSDAKQGTKIPVDYTRKKYVKKPPKSAVGFVIYTDYQTVLVDPDPHREALL